MKGIFLFLREIMLSPIAIGAAWPSSNKLAHAMAKNIALQQQAYAIELGAGTGVITHALLNCGISESQLMVLERSPALAQHLRKRFAKLTVVEGDALNLAAFINNKQPVQAIVSSLPLRFWTEENRKKMGAEIDKVLSPNGVFVQFTYGLFSKPQALSPKLQFQGHQYILWNLPPARVDVFRHVAD